MNAAAADYDAAIREVAREEELLAARTPDDDLADELRKLWDRRPDLRDLLGALGRYAEARGTS